MENTNFKQAEEISKKLMQDSMNFFSESAKIISETYNKQLELLTDASSKFSWDKNNFRQMLELFQKRVELYQSSFEKNSLLFKELIKNSVDYIGRKSEETWSSDKVNAIKQTFNKQMEYLTEVNQRYFDAISKQMKESKLNIDLKELSEKFQKNIKDNISISQDSIKVILDNFNKQADSSSEAGKKLLAEINKLIDFTVSRTTSFWDDMQKTFHSAKETMQKENNTGTKEKSKQRKNPAVNS